MLALQGLTVLIAIFIGARLGGIGLGALGGIGLGVLVFVFGLEPSSPPIDVLLIILAVVTAASTMQTAGGMDLLVQLAEKLLRKNPSWITFMGPLVTYIFTFCAGTGHVSYAILPIIAEVARESGVRPERPLSVSVIASQQAITSSPVSAATAAFLGILSVSNPDIRLWQILAVCTPATLMGCFVAALVVSHLGKELKDDPEYQRRLAAGEIKKVNREEKKFPPQASISVFLFLLGVVLIVVLGSFPNLRPGWSNAQGVIHHLSMPKTIELIMLSISGFIIMICKVKPAKIMTSSVFQAGCMALVGIFGIAWMGNTFFDSNLTVLRGGMESIITQAPWLFAFALFAMAALVNSQAATISALAPFGLALGISQSSMVAMFPATNGHFFFPSYPPIIAAINFDQTGTTKIGKYLFNHSFMIPGIVATATSVATGFLLASFVF